MAEANAMIPRLFVLWRTPDDSRRRFVVGHLWRENGTYFFAYHEDRHEAERMGFVPLAEFPDLRDRFNPYVSQGYLFSTFAQRIPSPRRPDYADLLKQWQVDHADDPFEILARSGGILTTDGIELAEYRAPDDLLLAPLRIRVAGARNYPGGAAARTGDRMRLVPDNENEFDQSAVRIERQDGIKLGYVPACYSDFVRSHLSGDDPISAILWAPIVFGDDPRRWQVELVRTARH